MFNRIKSSTLRGMATVVAAIVLFVSFSAAAAAQDRAGSVSGTVKDANGPVVGAAVFVKGGTTGETTDIDGKFRLGNLKANDVITVSIIGYETKEIVWNGQATLDILIREEATALKGVVVTAMGMVRQSESLTYAAETVGGKDVNDIKSINMINSLQERAPVWSSLLTRQEPADHPRSSSEATSPSTEATSLSLLWTVCL